MAGGAVRVGVLVGLPGALDLPHQAVRDVVVAVGMLRRNRRGAHDDLGPVGPQHIPLVLADLVGAHEHAVISLALRDQCESDPSIARGGLDDGAARLEQPRLLGGLDHLDGDAVLRAAAGIEVFDLGCHRREALGHHRVEPDEGGVADQIRDMLGDAHAGNAIRPMSVPRAQAPTPASAEGPRTPIRPPRARRTRPGESRVPRRGCTGRSVPAISWPRGPPWWPPGRRASGRARS
ncbi:Uncharacterised protein [Mycobacteroides abscessus subsp. massiliense]|nr:Uncharacterised protein [Mycobacteroides abscessus subsp. massiliense]